MTQLLELFTQLGPLQSVVVGILLAVAMALTTWLLVLVVALSFYLCVITFFVMLPFLLAFAEGVIDWAEWLFSRPRAFKRWWKANYKPWYTPL
jgi:hypothetical protein